jgi:hypothetical protein
MGVNWNLDPSDLAKFGQHGMDILARHWGAATRQKDKPRQTIIPSKLLEDPKLPPGEWVCGFLPVLQALDVDHRRGKIDLGPLQGDQF